MIMNLDLVSEPAMRGDEPEPPKLVNKLTKKQQVPRKKEKLIVPERPKYVTQMEERAKERKENRDKLKKVYD